MNEVWGVFIDEDMNMRSSKELKKLFSSEEKAKSFLEEYKVKWPNWSPDIAIKKISVE